MPLFLFKDIEKKSKEAANNQFAIDTKEIILDEEPLPSLQMTEQPFVILGHTQEVIYDYALWQSKKQTLGGLSAAEMAERFAKMISAKQRSQLKHLYLIACESGLYDSEKKPCYARELAYELFHQGFTAIAVHTITSPPLDETPQYAGMRVELVTRLGIEGQLEGLKLGHSRAFMTTPEYEATAERISALEAELQGIKGYSLEAANRRSQLNRQILSGNAQLQEESRKHLFMDVADLKKELERPENTFQAQASLKDIYAETKQWQVERNRVEQQKIQRQVKPLVSQKAQDEVYGPLIEQAREDRRLLAILAELSELQRRYRNDKKYIKNVDGLVALMKQKQQDWRQAIFEKMDKYHELSLLEQLGKNRAKSSFYDLMLHLVRAHRLKRGDVNPKLYETIKTSLPQMTIEHVIINKNKDKLDITLISKEAEKTILTEFSLNKQEQEKISPKLLQKKISKTHPRAEESKKTFVASVLPLELYEDDVNGASSHQLPKVSHYYRFQNRHHFWPAVIARGQFNQLCGDELKQTILADFKKKIEACNDKRSLKACVGSLRKTREFGVLSRAQDPLTYFFSWLPWVKTSSEKAFEQMLGDQESYLDTLKKNQ